MPVTAVKKPAPGPSIGDPAFAAVVEARLRSFEQSVRDAHLAEGAGASVATVKAVATGFLTLFDAFGVSVGASAGGVVLRDPGATGGPVQKGLGAFGLEDAMAASLFTPGQDLVILTKLETLLDAMGGDDIVVLARKGQLGAVFGNSGADMILGNAADDVLLGGSGADLLLGDDGADILGGGTGSDRLGGGAGDDVLRGGKGLDAIEGNQGADRLWGDTGADSLSGGTGDDALYGGDGDDTLEGGADDDGLDGGKGHDVLSGDGGDDEIRGRSGDDLILGGTGRDALYGTRGDDTLVGGGGADEMTGGSGADTFVFVADDLGKGQDIVTDLKAVDALRLEGFDDLQAAPDRMAYLADHFGVTEAGDGLLQIDALDLLILNVHALDAAALEARVLAAIDIA